MKYLYPAIFFLFPLLLSGCIKDDTSDCEDESTLILRFEYFDADGKDVYNNRIEKIDVILFDQGLGYYGWLNLSREDVARRMTEVKLSPGDYYIVSWANGYGTVNGATSGIDAGFMGARIHHDYGNAYTDPLHYAPDHRQFPTRSLTRADDDEDENNDDEYAIYRVTVPEGSKEHTMAFMSAHRTINVYIRGLKEIGDPDSEYPNVTFTSLASYYDFTLSYDPTVDPVDFTRATTHRIRNDFDYAYTSVYTPHFDNKNDINIIITRPAEPDFSDVISLEEFLEKEKITVYDGDNLVIDIEIVYDSDGTLVAVNLKNWDVIEVNPGKG